MENISIPFKGIQRQLPYQSNPDGPLDELINLRHYKGRLQPIGQKPVEWSVPSSLDFDSGWVHEMDDETNWIAVDYTYFHYNLRIVKNITEVFDTNTVTDIISYYDVPVRIEFLKRFMIVIYEGGMDRFVWKPDVTNRFGGSYVLLNINVRPSFAIEKTSDFFQSSGQVVNVLIEDIGTAVIGKYFEKLNVINNEGSITGGMFVMAAFRLFDGSYVMHTIPVFASVNSFSMRFVFNKNSTNVSATLFFNSTKLSISLKQADYTQFADSIDIISSVDIFASKFETIVAVDDNLAVKLVSIVQNNTYGSYELNNTVGTYVPIVNQNFKDLNDSASWYKIGEYSLAKILEGDVNEELDLKDFYQDYATRETLPIDNFSHHELAANVTFNYNSRLIVGDVKTKFGKYQYFPLTNEEDESLIKPDAYIFDYSQCRIRILVTLETDSGTFYVLTDKTTRYFYANATYPGKYFFTLALGQLGYPDARAKLIDVLVSKDSGQTWSKTSSYSLKKSKYGNFAYYIDPDFNTSFSDHLTGTANFPLIMHDITATTAVNLDAYPETQYHDSNRVQISEVNNPFFFAAENSYQIGTGRIIGISANTEPISTGQFGEHPLIVFTLKGIWAILQGSGSVLFSSIVPVSGEVATPGSIVAISHGVVYATSKGLFLLQGQQTTELTTLATGSPNIDFQTNINYRYYISNDKLVQLINFLSTSDILEYLNGANIGYDHVNKELVVSNSTYSYSYVYGFESNIWFKLDFSVKVLINYYPKLFAFSRNDTVNTNAINMSDEITTDVQKDVLITSQPMMLGSESFKVIRRVILRTIHETQEGVFNSGFYLFGSSDLINWQRITGRNHISGRKRDILLQRSGSKFKYFIFVFAGKLKVLNCYIADLQVSFDYKANNKLR